MCSVVNLRLPLNTSEMMLGVPKMSVRSFLLEIVRLHQFAQGVNLSWLSVKWRTGVLR